MPPTDIQPVVIRITDNERVSGLLCAPREARAGYVLAHGAGAGMTHAFLAHVATELADRGIATLRFQFPSMERGSRRPDPPAVAHAAVRAAVAEAGRLLAGLPLFAGGKSFGARMTSQAQAAAPLPGVLGLAFLGFPLHPPDKPSTERARHLAQVQVPMLFIQGTRDEFAEPALLQQTLEALGARAPRIDRRGRPRLPRTGALRPHGCRSPCPHARYTRRLDRRHARTGALGPSSP